MTIQNNGVAKTAFGVGFRSSPFFLIFTMDEISRNQYFPRNDFRRKIISFTVDINGVIMEPDPNTMYMIPAEACRVLNMGPGDLKSLVWAKKLETVLVGGRVMLYRAEVDRYAAKVKGTPVIPSTPDAWVRQKKLGETFGIPDNTPRPGSLPEWPATMRSD